MPSHTPEERKKKKKKEQEERIRAGRKFIGEREKRASKLEQQGASLKQARQTATRDITAGVATEGRTVEEAQEGKAELVTTLEKGGVFEADPERVELDPAVRSQFAASVPFIGSGAEAVTNIIITSPIFQKLYPAFSPKADIDFQTLIQNPETQREILLQGIQQQVIDEGLTLAEKMGAIIEALPLGAGATARRFGGELISDPKANVDTIIATIQSLGSQSTNLGEKGGTAKVQPPFLLSQLEDFENLLVEYEQRVKILIESSAVLREDPDQVNKIETAILDARIRIKNNRDIIAAGAVTIPSDATLIIEMLKSERR